MAIVCQNDKDETRKSELYQFFKEMERKTEFHYKVDEGIFFSDKPYITHVVCSDKGKITGYGILGQYDADEAEITLMAPEKEEILTDLMAGVRQQVEKTDAKRMLVIIDSRDKFLQRFLEWRNGLYLFSEFGMVYQGMNLPEPSQKEILLEKAKEEDAKKIAYLWNPKAASAEVLPEDLASTYVYRSGKKIVAVLRVDEAPERYSIYGFVVAPEFRNRGIGRQVLHALLRKLSAQPKQQIYLEVDKNNPAALHLYQSSGFKITVQYDYYALKV